MFTSRNSLAFLIFLLFLVTIWFREIPFFADTTYYSEIAVNLYENGFSKIIPPYHNDPGGPAIFSWGLALSWLIFGKSLLVSHLYCWLIICLFLYESYRFARKFLPDKYVAVSLLLLCADPTILTQLIVMGYDIILGYFFIFTLNRLLEKKTVFYIIGTVLLVLYGVRGIPLIFSLGVIEFILAERKSISPFLKIIPSALVFIGWMLYHKSATGWYIFSPMREVNAEALETPQMFIRKIGFSIWKILDLGRIVLFIPFLFLLSKNYKISKQLFIIAVIPSVVVILFLSSFTNPIGHRYFLLLFPLIIVASLQVVSQIKIRIEIVTVAAVVALAAGNFIYYPERFGNAWDSSLKIMPWFEIKKEVRSFIVERNIPFDSIGAKTPLLDKTQFAELKNTDMNFAYVPAGMALSTKPYFAFSNISTMYSEAEKTELMQSWKLLHKWEKGFVKFYLFERKNNALLK